MNYNKVILVGRLTRNPETRVLPSGQQVANFGLATDRYYTDRDGQRQQKTEFHNIVLFGKLAEIANQYLKKGSLALFEGRLQTRSWQDQNGNQRQRTEIIGEAMQLGPKPQQDFQGLSTEAAGYDKPQKKETETQNENLDNEEIPIIEENEEIDIKNIPF